MEKNILIVDDDADQLMALRGALEILGYEVSDAANITDAIAVIEDKQVDLIITDVEMPGGTGIELLKSVKESHPHIPVVIHTGRPKFDAAVECVKIGAVDYLPKPVDVEKLMEIVSTALAPVTEADYFDAARTLKTDRLGCILSGYKIIETLGEGSYGVVFLAQKQEQNTVNEYAIKLIKTNTFSADDSRDYLDRFLHEAEAASCVLHPNIIGVVEHGLAEDEMIPFLVMEYFPGKTLKVLMSEEDCIDYLQKARLIRQIADALAAVHLRGICHRDIKPDNILVNTDQFVKLMDFGVARLPESELTMTTAILGTPFYLSPEGFISAKIDNRADIFSLGVVAYELFVGKRPFHSDSLAVLMRLIHQVPPLEPKKSAPDFPAELQNILAVMLKKDRNQRYQTAREVVADIDDFLASNNKSLNARLKPRLAADDWQ